MKLFKFALTIFAWLISPITHADKHQFVGEIDVDAPFNIQAQMCALADGVTQKDYDAFLQDYFAWSRKHDVEVTFIRQESLFTHAYNMALL